MTSGEHITGTHWGEGDARKYQAAGHGPDGAVFLDPYVYGALSSEHVKDRRVLDIGMGTGPWAEHCAREGAREVFGVDINEAMLRTAQSERFQKVPGTVIEHRARGGDTAIALVRASAAALPFPDQTMDVLMSINLGCNLPSSATGDSGTVINPFAEHFREAFRVAKSGATMVVTAPHSLDTVFTDDEVYPSDVQAILDEEWARSSRTPEAARQIIAGLGHVLRGTFVLSEDGPKVVRGVPTQSIVQNGTPILRKIPGLVVDNMYHDAESYVRAAEAAGWVVEERREPTFGTERKQFLHNQIRSQNAPQAGPATRLGKEYIKNPPFLFLKLKKP